MRDFSNRQLFVFINAGYNAYRQGNYEDAITNYNAAIHVNPHSPLSYRLRADAKIKKGKYQEAIHDCDIAITLNPADPAYLTRGFAHYFSYQNQNAVDDLARLSNLTITSLMRISFEPM